MKIDMEFVRAQFPALAGEWTFFDNAGGSQTLKQVADRIHDYLMTSDVQLGASYETSRIAGERVAEGSRMTAQMINAPDENEVILGPSTTVLLRNLAHCLGETYEPGDEVIVTNCDHEANIGGWRSLEKKGMVIKEWRVNPDTLDLHLEDLETLMTDRTRMVALTHASNILGTVNSIRDISDFVHQRGALICVDGVAYAPHALVDVQALDVDFYAFSFYKVYGPHYAMLYGKKAHLMGLPGINHFFIENDNVPYKFQPGSVNYELAYGLLGLGDYFTCFAEHHGFTGKGVRETAAFTFDGFAEHEEALSKRLMDFLNAKPNVRVIGRTEAARSVRMPTVSFVVKDTISSSVTLKVDEHKIGIRHGDFYARRLIEDLGLMPQDGVIRVSMVHYNTLEEVDRLIKVLDGLF